MTRKEALNKVRQMSLPKETMEILEALAPELKESEDERIRKELIETINCMKEDHQVFLSEQQIERYLAWLEKHSEEEIKKIRNEEYTNGFNNAAGFGK